MFSPSVYAERRRDLITAERPTEGLVVFLGNGESAMNYEGNPYPFRQDSTFLYYFGIDAPGLVATLDLDSGESRLYGDDPSLDDVIWMGNRPLVADYAERSGIDATASQATLHDDVARARERDRSIHCFPPYRPDHSLRLSDLLGIAPDRIETAVSDPLLRTVVGHRSIKSEEEVEQLEEAVDVTAKMHEKAMHEAAPDRTEREVAGTLTGLANTHGRGLSFRPTCSIHGEVLHNHNYSNRLSSDDLLLVDAGASSSEYYAGDVTRVVPVDGTFTRRQRVLYEAVLDAQTSAIDVIEPGVPFLDIHLHACHVLTGHLKDIGLMHGDVEEAVAAGAHALFFPHGLGHMLGLDTHDMENLGEDRVGYAPGQRRSDQFGLHTLRLARPIEPGFVVTVEPGCYFIPELIRRWRDEGRHSAFIDYEAVAKFEDVGGIRIEDDVLVTDDGARVLGPGIPKTVDAVEQQARAGS